MCNAVCYVCNANAYMDKSPPLVKRTETTKRLAYNMLMPSIVHRCGLMHVVIPFADALDNVPLALAENSGLAPIDSLTEVKSKQLADGNPHLGIDCNDVGTNDMREQNVFETLSSKKQQLFLATQVCKMILKIDDVIQPSQYD